jgi:hypothetical protein
MTFETFDAVLYTVTFLVPGFIWSAVLSMLIPRRSQAIEVRLLEFLTLSCINHGLWIWLLLPIFKGDFMDSHPFWAGAVLIFPLVASPVLLGLGTAHLHQKDWIRRFLGRFGFRTVHPIPTAWDYHFSRGRPYWVIVLLRDGSRVYGRFGPESFAGDDPDERDLYLEAVFRLTPTGEPAIPQSADGGWWQVFCCVGVVWKVGGG